MFCQCRFCFRKRKTTEEEIQIVDIVTECSKPVQEILQSGGVSSVCSNPSSEDMKDNYNKGVNTLNNENFDIGSLSPVSSFSNGSDMSTFTECRKPVQEILQNGGVSGVCSNPSSEDLKDNYIKGVNKFNNENYDIGILSPVSSFSNGSDVSTFTKCSKPVQEILQSGSVSGVCRNPSSEDLKDNYIKGVKKFNNENFDIGSLSPVSSFSNGSDVSTSLLLQLPRIKEF